MPHLLIGLFAVGQPLIGCQQINSFLKSLGENKLLFNRASAVAVEERNMRKWDFCHLERSLGMYLHCPFLHYDCGFVEDE